MSNVQIIAPEGIEPSLATKLLCGEAIPEEVHERNALAATGLLYDPAIATDEIDISLSPDLCSTTFSINGVNLTGVSAFKVEANVNDLTNKVTIQIVGACVRVKGSPHMLELVLNPIEINETNMEQLTIEEVY